MNTLTFYIVRFAAPAVGFLLLAITGRPPGPRWFELLSIAISITIMVGVLFVLRSDALARRVGTPAARLVRRVRKDVDGEARAQACLGFRSHISARFRYGFPRSLAALVGMLVADLAILALCLRFVGVDCSEVDLLAIGVAYLFAYPFTIFPFSGIGVVDALVLAGLVEAGGIEIEAACVAALLVWRVFTVAGPVLMGVGALAIWRRTLPRQPVAGLVED